LNERLLGRSSLSWVTTAALSGSSSLKRVARFGSGAIGRQGLRVLRLARVRRRSIFTPKFWCPLIVKNCVVNDGAAGLSFGVSGRWEEVGRVPIGAWSGLWVSREGSKKSSSTCAPNDRLLVDPHWTEGRRDWLRDHVCDALQSGASGLLRRFDRSCEPHARNWLSVDGLGRLSNE